MAGYSEYLMLDELLALQRLRTDRRNTELPFIVVHQVSELLAKLVINDLGAAICALDDDDLPSTLRSLRRVHEVDCLLLDQLRLIEHLPPGGFADLRSALGTASAAESRQFATIEVLSGPPRGDGQVGLARDLWTALCAHARRTGRDMPSGHGPGSQQRRIRTLVEIYRAERGLLSDVCEALLDHDHAFSMWRYRHSLAAARNIGDRPGTGGTSGVAYLRRRSSRRFYPDLWATRNSMVAAAPCELDVADRPR
ncbi:tryptophan 2,3-dioxygenase family protein [Jatrophihabitans sp.]|uniref:tryptophan 2,3-dioxygenase family protein n=1 Tax=Jatrophihabitans sp. TaxID=1932789 RepID=UPI0030C6F6B3|nr:tryptophan 23-dioxygenase [Jatrophihabitans sp.]